MSDNTKQSSNSSTNQPAPFPSIEMSKAFDPVSLEIPLYEWWEESGFFKATKDPDAEPFTIMIPPPNVTGALHLGHALNNSMQDLLIRRARLQGKAALWVPGTDHAGVATQSVVEKRLWNDEKKTRNDVGREELIKQIWEWKEVYEKRILGQLRRLGASLDWSRTQFTMSTELSKAVRYVFLDLFREGLIYRGKRLINWSPGIQTALSNDELDHKAVKGHFWYFKYPIQGEDGEFIEIATTRPETMLGDTAVAVHPDPEAELNRRLEKAKAAGNQEKIEALEQRIKTDLPRLKKVAAMIGKIAMLPLVNRPIPIIGDAILADPEKGTGAVKITPAHDPNDYACGKRNDLAMINILNPDATLNENAGAYEGLHGSTTGREKVVADLKELGLLTKVEDHEHEVAHCYRSHTVIEPYLLSQWFVKMQPLVDLARKCYQDGEVKFTPEHRGRDYLRWLDSTPDWCISRQIWWGHRIPIWYCIDCNPTIETNKEGDPNSFSIPENALPILPESDDPNGVPSGCPSCKGKNLVQDPDVLDTWFSSQLWPLSTLGWPEKTEDLDYFYPTNVLITGRDIIALWVARMIMVGMKFEGKTPFHDVIINGTVQDERGDIMSKSRGNGFDPVRVIEGGSDEIHGGVDLKTDDGMLPKDRVEHYPAYGADALRYGLFTLTTGHSQDIRIQIKRKERKKTGKFNEYDVNIPRFEEGKRFCNKIWQASRGVVFRQCEDYKHDSRVETDEDKWLNTRIHDSILQVDKHLNAFELGEACDVLYRLFWDDYCSWYLEIIKPRLWGRQGEESKAQAQTSLIKSLDSLLKLLHPFMPYMTEALWQELKELQGKAGITDLPISLMVSNWPKPSDFPRDQEGFERTETLREIASVVNQTRSQHPNIPENTKLPKLIISGGDEQKRQALSSGFSGLSRFLKIEEVTESSEENSSKLSATAICRGYKLTLPLEDVLDVDAEKARLQKQIENHENTIQRLEKQLSNERFVAKAPAQVVQQNRDKLVAEQQALVTLQAQIDDLSKL